MKDKLIYELKFCLEHWEKYGFCKFGERTECSSCAAPYLLYKLITGEVIDGKKLGLEEWKAKLESLE
jgi:hypothetical protein